MRVALITPGFSDGEGDWCVPALLDLVRALADEDDVTVVALRYPHHRRPYRVHGARVLPLGAAQRRGPGRMGMALRALRTLRRETRNAPFDVLHALWAHEPGALAVRAGRRLGAPVLVSILGGELADLPEIDYGGARGPVNRRLVRHALAGAARITVGSETLRRQALHHVAGERMAIVPLGVDLERFSPAPAPGDPDLEGDPAILAVASLAPVKDPANLLAAFVRLRAEHPGAHLHLVGDGPLAPTLAARATALGVDACVTFHGAVDHGALPGYYRAADLHVLASRFESQGMVTLEALACGCPVAGTAVGLLPEVAPEHVAPPDNAIALAEAVTRALAAPRDADACRARVAPFALATTVARWRALYAELAAGTG